MAQDNGVDKTWAGILAAASGGCMLWSLLKCHQTRAVTEAKTRCALMVFGVANAALTTALIALAVVIINSQKPSATSSSQLAQWLLAVTQFSLVAAAYCISRNREPAAAQTEEQPQFFLQTGVR